MKIFISWFLNNKSLGRLFSLFLIFCSLNIYSQLNLENLSFKEIKSGLPKNTITAIKKDSEGFLWFGTNGFGLYKYDSKSYTRYYHEIGQNNTLNGNLIYDVFNDSLGNLWIITDNGLCRYNKFKDNFDNLKIKEKLGVESPSLHLFSIIEDNNHNLLLGTQNEGLLRMSIKTGKVSRVDQPIGITREQLFIDCLEKDKNGNVYLGTKKGLLILDNNEQRLSAYFKLSNNVNKYDFNNIWIKSMVFDNSGQLWLGTVQNGIFSLDINTKKIRSYPVTTKKVFCLNAFEDNLVAATETDGLLILNSEKGLVKKYLSNYLGNSNLRVNSIWSMLIDNENRLWIGYFRGGVDVVDIYQNKFKSLNLKGNIDSRYSPVVNAMRFDLEGNLWICGDELFEVVNDEKDKFNSITKKILSNYDVTQKLKGEDIFIDSKQNVWLGKWGKGAYLLEKKSQKFIHFDPSEKNSNLKTYAVKSFAEDEQGRIWMGSHLAGLHYYDYGLKKIIHCKSKDFVETGLIYQDVNIVFVDSHNHIWAGSSDGLFKITKVQNGDFRVEDMKPKMQRGLTPHPNIHVIFSIHERKDGTVLVGTNGAGLFSYDRSTDEFNSINRSTKFNDPSINGIFEDNQNNLWITGSLGMHLLTKDYVSKTIFPAGEGINELSFSNGAITQSENGLIYIAGANGIKYLDPSLLKTNPFAPIIKLTGFSIFNRKVTPHIENSPLDKVITFSNNLELNYDQTSFSFEFIGINYSGQEKNEYAYMLEGLDKNWNFVNNSTIATYTNIDYGNYLFKVKASNNDGVWTKRNYELKITINPPWWKTNYAYTFYLALILCSMYFLIRNFKERLKQKQLIFLERERRIQQETLHQAKMKFFTNISHEFRTPLTLIINPIQNLLNEKDLPPQLALSYRIINKNAVRLSRLINNLMEFRNMKNERSVVVKKWVNIVHETEFIINNFAEEASMRKINLSLCVEAKKTKIALDTNLFESILFNVISNAFKFTPNKGEIRIRIENVEFDSNPEKAVRISIIDNGIGIDKNNHKKIFKRFYQVEDFQNQTPNVGTGIGLELTKNYMELHGGHIEVESSLGQGSSFHLIFPLNNEISNNLTKDQKAFGIQSFKSPLLINNQTIENQKKTKTILIVEDNLDLRLYLKKELSVRYNIILAEDGEKGLLIATNQFPDVILTDIMMPNLNGIDFCKKIKSNLSTSHIPIIMLTALSDVKHQITGIDSGADANIPKPFYLALLISTIDRIMESREIYLDKYYLNGQLSFSQKITSVDSVFIKKLTSYISENILDVNLNVDMLASYMFLSKSQLYRKVKVLTSFSPNELVRKIRLEKAKEILFMNPGISISEVAYQVGFSSASYFSQSFKKEYGHSPTKQLNNEES